MEPIKIPVARISDPLVFLFAAVIGSKEERGRSFTTKVNGGYVVRLRPGGRVRSAPQHNKERNTFLLHEFKQ